MSKPLKGKFKCQNPDKYKGNHMLIEYRSSWEKNFMNYLDTRQEIEWWQSEEKAIWYFDPVSKRKRRYFPDFIIHFKRSDGIMVTEVIEIKPYRQTQTPNPNPKRKTQAWFKEWCTFATNKAKWDAAMEWSENRGYNFRIITEKDVNFIAESPNVGVRRPTRNKKRST